MAQDAGDVEDGQLSDLDSDLRIATQRQAAAGAQNARWGQHSEALPGYGSAMCTGIILSDC